jgi:hypothetical protein
LPECGSVWQTGGHQKAYNSVGTYRDVGSCRSSTGRGRFRNDIPLRIDTYSSGFRTEPGNMTQNVAGTVSQSTFGHSGTYTLKCNLNPLALDVDMLNKRKCIYEKNVSTRPGTATSATVQKWHNRPSVEEHPEAGEGANSINSMMW